MPKWLSISIGCAILTITIAHFVSPGAIPNWLAILIFSTLIIVQLVYLQIRRQKELEQIRGELQELREELKELKGE
jgi:flagellar biosynthesis protein FlhB